jgi:hypothetical protein
MTAQGHRLLKDARPVSVCTCCAHPALHPPLSRTAGDPISQYDGLSCVPRLSGPSPACCKSVCQSASPSTSRSVTPSVSLSVGRLVLLTQVFRAILAWCNEHQAPHEFAVLFRCIRLQHLESFEIRSLLRHELLKGVRSAQCAQCSFLVWVWTAERGGGAAGLTAA